MSATTANARAGAGTIGMTTALHSQARLAVHAARVRASMPRRTLPL